MANGVPVESPTRPSEQCTPGVLAGVMFSQARACRCVRRQTTAGVLRAQYVVRVRTIEFLVVAGNARSLKC